MTARSTSAVKVLAAATTGQAFGMVAVTMASFGVFVRPLASEFGWRRGDVSLAITIFNVCNVIMLPIGGWLIDRAGVRRILIPSIVLFGLTLASLSQLAGPIWMLYIGYALLSVLGIGTHSVGYSRLIVGWFSRNRGLALGTSLAGMGISVAILPLLAQTLVTHASWRVAYFGLGALSIAAALPAVLLWAWDPPGSGSAAQTGDRAAITPGTATVGMPFHDAVRCRSFILLTIAFTLLGLLTGAVPSHLVPLLVERGVDPMKAAMFASALGLSLIAGRFVTGYLMDRVFAPFLMIIIIGIALAGLIMMLIPVHGPWLIVSIAFIGFAMGSDTDLLAYMVSRYIGLRAFTRVYALLLAAFGVGTSAGPFLMGFSANLVNSYDIGLGALVGATLIAVVPFLMMGRYPQRTHVSFEGHPSCHAEQRPHAT